MGKLYIVGLGPGAYEQMTLEAINALAESNPIVGYTVYIDLIKDYFKGKDYLTTPMKKEEDRCRMALEAAQVKESVAMVCSGDCGIYGMAGLLYTMKKDYPEVTLEVIPGITASVGGAALLGAPLSHDFATISLSDLLTPWDLIEKRLLLAAEADLVICLYNPSSKKRSDYLQKACDLLLLHKGGETACGIAVNVGRSGEFTKVMTLKELREEKVDMFTTVFIGNSNTQLMEGKMITPRGYAYERK